MTMDDEGMEYTDAEDRQAHQTEHPTLLQGPVDIRSLALSVLAILALGGTLYVARAVLLPVVLAVVLSFLLAPIIKALARFRIPAPVGTAMVLLGILGLVGYGAVLLSEPATMWMQQLPQSLSRLEARIRPVAQSVEKLGKATEKMEDITQVESEAAQQALKVEVQHRSLTGTILNQTLSVVALIGAMIILLYFLLASGDLFLLKLVRVIPRFADKKTAVTIVHQVEQDISRYLMTITMINTGLGVAVGVAMLALDMPNPVLWGVMAGCFNFIPYLGAMASAIVLTLVALLTFDQLGRALLVPGVFLALTSLEGFFVTPMVVGHRLTLNPVAIFLWLTLWGWLWGVPGMLLAVPLLAIFKIICDHIRPLQPIGEFIGK